MAAQGKGSKTNPTRDRGDELVGGNRLTATPCDHCGAFIPQGQVVAIKRPTFNDEGGSRTRTYRFAKGHATDPRVI